MSHCPNGKQTDSNAKLTYSFLMGISCYELLYTSIPKKEYDEKVCKWFISYLLGGYERCIFEEALIKSGSVKMEANHNLFKVTYTTSKPISKKEETEFQEWFVESRKNYLEYKGQHYYVDAELAK